SRLGRATPRSRRGGLKNSWGEAAFEGPLRHGKTNATLDAPLEGHEGGAYIAQGGEEEEEEEEEASPHDGDCTAAEVQSGGARAAGRNPWSRRWRGRSEVQVGRLRRLAARHLSCAHTLKGSKPRVYSKLHSLNAKMLSKKSYAVKSPPVLS
ncbi:unnamed protein product, partial [Prorocentrum cordatum]